MARIQKRDFVCWRLSPKTRPKKTCFPLPSKNSNESTFWLTQAGNSWKAMPSNRERTRSRRCFSKILSIITNSAKQSPSDSSSNQAKIAYRKIPAGQSLTYQQWRFSVSSTVAVLFVSCAALNQLTKSLAVALAEHRIRVKRRCIWFNIEFQCPKGHGAKSSP